MGFPRIGGMMLQRRLISFDWALKRLLRSKTNFSILEGFLSELLRDDIKILEILESESNKEEAEDKFNRVDMKVKNKNGEIIIIEVQYTKELDFLQRILYSTSKVITEHIYESEAYKDVVKVISVNILFFDLGHGEDYVYHGTTNFRGIHKDDVLELSPRQKEVFSASYPRDLYPEYYLLNVSQFNDVAKDGLDEWIYFLKNEEIKGEFQARGLKAAKEVLDILRLSPEERAVYQRHLEDIRYQKSMFISSYGMGKLDGEKKGMIKGMKKGIEKGVKSVAIKLLDVLDDQTISEKTGLSKEDVERLRNDQN